MVSTIHPAQQPTATTPNLLIRPAAERFHSRHGWLDSWHSFSFASHYDPRWMEFGPLRVINDDIFGAGGGFGMHPHRDMEIITVMVEGALKHQDSMGHTGHLRAGEVQRMTAGTGVIHSEINDSSEPCRLLQIWLEPQERGLRPEYEQRLFTVASEWTPLIHPERIDGAMAIRQNAALWRARPAAGETLQLPATPSAQRWIQMIDGAMELDLTGSDARTLLRKGDGMGITGPANGSLAAGPEGADLLLFDLG
ncbi:pirin family protein [Synechococcus sp. RSCCF101]|uniref:pirin family protein n=1 Tax=Synechococcus sp. RSCCF101 TaxID=2511069 RepID=UPI001248ABB2|nr:pirin-like bicupin family protein [Synechococcus sp. RSCCF101]QEY33039.1 pirin family protein [Synechococcus sp. RSCCF101]